MATYKTKPRTVEAVQWHGQELSELPPWAQDPRYVEMISSGPYGLNVFTKNGPVRIRRGDWIVLHNKEVHAFTDQYFLEHFEVVE